MLKCIFFLRSQAEWPKCHTIVATKPGVVRKTILFYPSPSWGDSKPSSENAIIWFSLVVLSLGEGGPSLGFQSQGLISSCGRWLVTNTYIFAHFVREKVLNLLKKSSFILMWRLKVSFVMKVWVSGRVGRWMDVYCSQNMHLYDQIRADPTRQTMSNDSLKVLLTSCFLFWTIEQTQEFHKKSTNPITRLANCSQLTFSSTEIKLFPGRVEKSL